MRSVHMTQGRGVGSNTKEADGCPVAGRTCRRLLRRSGSRKMAWGRYVLRQSWAAMMGGGHLLNPLASVHDVRISQTTVCLGSTHTFTLWRNFSQDKYPKFNYFKGCSVIENIILYGAQESLAILRSKCTIKLQWHVGILTPRGFVFEHLPGGRDNYKKNHLAYLNRQYSALLLHGTMAHLVVPCPRHRVLSRSSLCRDMVHVEEMHLWTCREEGEGDNQRPLALLVRRKGSVDEAEGDWAILADASCVSRCHKNIVLYGLKK